MIKIDLQRAKDITKDRLRVERTPLLNALDIEVMKNITDAVKLSEIEAEKQRLRDITLVVDTLNAIDELKAIKCS